jgi:glycolate oxidase iron-sulfur subunit
VNERDTPQATDWIDTQKLLACIHCGLCLPSCPTHILSGEEMPSPRGRLYLMRAVQEGRLSPGDSMFAEHELSCLVCRACETACPSGVEFGYLMEQTRAKLEHERPKSRVRRYVYTRLLRSRPQLNVLQSILAVASILKLTALAHALGRVVRPMWPKISAMLRLTPLHVRFPAVRRPASVDAPRKRIALMIGCIGDAFTAEINSATIRVLTHLGFDVVPITQATCCGALAIHAGYRSEALVMGKEMVDAALKTHADVILTSIAGCGAMLKDYVELLPLDQHVMEFSSKTRDITEFLADFCLEDLGRLRSSRPILIAYQAPCHLLHAQKVNAHPLKVIGAVQGVTVTELPENELCCGSAGTYNIEHPAESEQLLERKLDSIRETKPEMVLTANAGCLLQLRKGLRESHERTPVYHIVEWLDSLLSTNDQQ